MTNPNSKCLDALGQSHCFRHPRPNRLRSSLTTTDLDVGLGGAICSCLPAPYSFRHWSHWVHSSIGTGRHWHTSHCSSCHQLVYIWCLCTHRTPPRFQQYDAMVWLHLPSASKQSRRNLMLAGRIQSRDPPASTGGRMGGGMGGKADGDGTSREAVDD